MQIDEELIYESVKVLRLRIRYVLAKIWHSKWILFCPPCTFCETQCKGLLVGSIVLKSFGVKQILTYNFLLVVIGRA